MRMFLRRASVCVVATGLFIAPLSCFSERSSGPGIDLEGCDVQLPSEAFGSTIVVIRDFNFSPAQVSVSPGSKVTWVNCEPAGTAGHTSTADAGAWSSPLLAPGSTFTRQFSTAGPFPYHCDPHPGMRGTVTVE
jgi:plastocyanin